MFIFCVRLHKPELREETRETSLLLPLPQQFLWVVRQNVHCTEGKRKNAHLKGIKAWISWESNCLALSKLTSKETLPRLNFSCRGTLRTGHFKIMYVKIPSNSLLKYLCFYKRQERKSNLRGSLLAAPFQHLLCLTSKCIHRLQNKTSFFPLS